MSCPCTIYKNLSSTTYQVSGTSRQSDGTYNENDPSERATSFSSPGGLLETAERFVPGISASTRKIEGHPVIFNYLDRLSMKIKSGQKPVSKLIDCLNYERGCNDGTGTNNHEMFIDDLEACVKQHRKEREEERKSFILETVHAETKCYNRQILG